MKHVKATRMSVVKQIPITELGRVANEGDEFFCTENRFKWLTGHNKYNLVFATEIVEGPEDQVKQKSKKTK